MNNKGELLSVSHMLLDNKLGKDILSIDLLSFDVDVSEKIFCILKNEESDVICLTSGIITQLQHALENLENKGDFLQCFIACMHDSAMRDVLYKLSVYQEKSEEVFTRGAEITQISQGDAGAIYKRFCGLMNYSLEQLEGGEDVEIRDRYDVGVIESGAKVKELLVNYDGVMSVEEFNTLEKSIAVVSKSGVEMMGCFGEEFLIQFARSSMGYIEEKHNTLTKNIDNKVKNYLHGNATFYGLIVNYNLIVMCNIEQIDNEVGFFRGYYVDAKYQKDFEVGTLFIEKIIQQMLGYHSFTLNVLEENISAKSLFLKKLGGKVLGEVENLYGENLLNVSIGEKK